MIPELDIYEGVKQLAKTVSEGKDGIKWVAVSIFAGIARTIVSSDTRNITEFTLSAVTAGFVGYMAYLGLTDTSLSDSTSSVIIGIAAFSATDLLKGIMKITKAFADNPNKAIKEILTIWRRN